MNKVSIFILCTFVFNTTVSTITSAQAIRSASNRTSSNRLYYMDYVDPNDTIGSGLSSSDSSSNTTPTCGENANLNETGDGCECITGYIQDAENLSNCIQTYNAPEYQTAINEIMTRYNAKLSETETACKSILGEMNDMMGLSGWTTGLSVAGTLAAGTALGAGLAKSSTDNQIESQEKTIDALEKEIPDAGDIDEATGIENADQTIINNQIAAANEKYNQNYDALKTSELALIEKEISEKELEVSKIKEAITNISADITSKLNGFELDFVLSSTSGDISLNGNKLTADEVLKIKNLDKQLKAKQQELFNPSEELAKLQEEKEAIESGTSPIEGINSSSAISDTLNWDDIANETKANLNTQITEKQTQVENLGASKKTNEEKSKALGLTRTIALGAATLTSAGATTTSAINISKAGSVFDKMKDCSTKLYQLNSIKAELEANVISTDNSTEDDFENVDTKTVKVIERANKIIPACSGFDEDNMESVKNLSIGSTVTSAIGTAAGGVGIWKSIEGNKELDDTASDEQKKKKKNANTLANVMAGVTTGTSATSTILGALQIDKIKKDLEKAEQCNEIFEQSLWF